MRVEFPELGPGFRIEREDVIVGRAEEKLVLNQDRCGFKCRLADEVSFLVHRAGAVGPG